MATRRRSRCALSEEERAKKRAAERELMAAATQELRSSEGWQRWLRVRRHFRTYSFHNQLLIAHQRPGATRVAGFRRWLTLGYAVRKGERGLCIWAPCPPSKEKLRQWREAGAKPDDRPPTFFRLVKVFDRSQVEPLPEFPGGAVDLDPPIEPVQGDGLAGLLEPLAAFASSIGCHVVIEEIEGAANGYFDPRSGKIAIDEIGPEFSPNAQVQTEIHELAHALVRRDRRAVEPKLSYAEEEVVVECVAYTVCSAVGLDTAGFSVPYMTAWSDGLEIECFAALIDRLAKRLEDAALAADEEDEQGIKR
ncbi:MAG TPA: ArdC family protein [Solirubrobacterales bacterium]